MQKEILLQMLEQNRMDCSHFCKNINAENIDFRLTEQTASVGFIYRHIGETTNLIGKFFCTTNQKMKNEILFFLNLF